jgi:hypothetical protein
LGHFKNAEELRTDDFETIVWEKAYLQMALGVLKQTSSMREIQFSDKR